MIFRGLWAQESPVPIMLDGHVRAKSMGFELLVYESWPILFDQRKKYIMFSHVSHWVLFGRCFVSPTLKTAQPNNGRLYSVPYYSVASLDALTSKFSPLFKGLAPVCLAYISPIHSCQIVKRLMLQWNVLCFAWLSYTFQGIMNYWERVTSNAASLSYAEIIGSQEEGSWRRQ